MKTHDTHSEPPPMAAKPAAARAWKGAAVMFGLILAFYLLREHWGHALGLLPYVILLACPLMHLFGHGHHDHSHHDGQNDHKSP